MWPQISQIAAMRRDDVCIYVSPANRVRLEAIITDRNSKSKAVWRARIMLATADGLGTNAIMRLTGKSKPCVWRWQERYVQEGVDGLLRDKTRIRHYGLFANGNRADDIARARELLSVPPPGNETDDEKILVGCVRFCADRRAAGASRAHG